MKVQLGDREVWIEFAYTKGPAGVRFVRRLEEVTHCLLRDGSAPRAKNEVAPILASGIAVRYHLDPPNRELARKAALTKALAELDRVLPVYQAGAHPAVQAEALKCRRRLFWTVYQARKLRASSVQPRVLSAPSNQTA